MMTSELIFLSGIAAISGLQFLECWGYLRISQKIKEPLSLKGQVSIGIAWLIMAVLICANGIVGIKLINFSEVPLNRAIGVLPIVIGFVFSVFAFKSDWKDFHRRFQRKKG